MRKIYISYAKTPKNELVISCYHEMVQATANAFALAKKEGLNAKSLKKLTGELPEAYNQEHVKAKWLELLMFIKQEEERFEKVIYTGDLNLCCKNDEIAYFLFDNTINSIFATTHRTLESSNPDYVATAIKFADMNNLTGMVIQTKKLVTDGAISKTYLEPKGKTDSYLHRVGSNPSISSPGSQRFFSEKDTGTQGVDQRDWESMPQGC